MKRYISENQHVLLIRRLLTLRIAFWMYTILRRVCSMVLVVHQVEPSETVEQNEGTKEENGSYQGNASV